MRKVKILILMIGLFFNINIVNAATVNANISVSTNSTIIGNSGTATLTISSTNNQHIGQIYGTFSCGGLGSIDLKYVEMNNPPTSKSYTIKWTAKSAGTYTCSVSNLEVGILEEPSDFVTAKVGTKSITVNKKSSSSGSSSGTTSGGTTSDKKTYSSDNNLSSLSIEGQELNPKFNKDTTEYSLTLDQSIEKVKINAKANDSKAKISGTGEINLSDGENIIEIKVTAENGNEKIYKIKITVEDQHPIKVTIDNKTYTIMKKNNNIIEKPEGYEEQKITIEEQEVISYTNPNNNLTLIILKDEEGNCAYYIFKNNEYTLYEENTFNNLKLYLLDMPEDKIPEGYKEYKFTYNEKEYVGYKLDKYSDYYLIYAMNLNDGKEGLYTYDSKTNIASRYDESIEKYYLAQNLKEVMTYKNVIMAIVGINVAILIIVIIKSIIKGSKKRRK